MASATLFRGVQNRLRLESEMNSELTRAHIPTLLGRATLMPLESDACPAVAVEVAPLNGGTPVADAQYQQQVADALTAALLNWSADWRLP
jgi:N-acetylmuramoyl-L-alanine amidase